MNNTNKLLETVNSILELRGMKVRYTACETKEEIVKGYLQFVVTFKREWAICVFTEWKANSHREQKLITKILSWYSKASIE